MPHAMKPKNTYSKVLIGFLAALLATVGDVVVAQATSQASAASLFVHIGSSTRFSEGQLGKIADNYGIVNIAKFHAQWNSADQQADAKRIKSLNSNIKINVYYSSSLMFWMNKSIGSDSRFKDYYGRARSEFNDDWLLRDAAGNIIYLGDTDTAFADLSNIEYRKWAVNVISEWKLKAPYDGVFFDNSRTLGAYGKAASTSIVSGWNIDWNVLIGAQKVDDYNYGLNQLFIESQTKFGDIVYNGIARRNYTPSRNTDLLEHSNGAMNEGFCMWRKGASDLVPGTIYTLWTPAEMLNDIEIMISSSAAPHNKTILQKVNHSGSTAQYNDGIDVVTGSKQIKRYCFGSFLLGHRPGHTFFKYGPDYGPRELDSDPKETGLDLGSPVDMKYSRVASDAYKREFENGMVYVNLSNDTTAVMPAPYPMTLMNGALEGASYDVKALISVPPKDAFFFNWSHSALFLKNGSMGAWTSNTPFNNLVNAPLFGWQVFKSADFIAYSTSYPTELANSTRPIIINFSRALDITETGLNLSVEAIENEMDLLLANPDYKRKIRGINWDWENDSGVSISPDLAAATLKRIYDYGHRRGLIFGIAVQPGDISLSNAGITDLTKVKDFADFFMPMEYAQWFGGGACDKDADGNFLTEAECFNRRKQRISNDLTKFSALRTAGVPVVVVANIKTIKEPIERLSPCQMYDLYKNVLYSTSTPTADGFALWKLRELDKDYMTVFNTIKDGNPIKSSACPLPTVSLTAPAAGALVSGSAVAVGAVAADDIGVKGVQFQFDGANLGPEVTTAPYGVIWNTRSAADGAHVLTAVARDAAGNTTTSTAVGVTVDNAPPVISAVSAADVSSGAATIGWITDEASNSRVEYGTATTYGMRTALSTAPVTAHSQALSGLSAGTLYHFRVRSRDAAGNMAISADSTITTAAEIKLGPPSTTLLDISPAIQGLYPAALSSFETTLETLPEGGKMKITAGTLTDRRGVSVSSAIEAKLMSGGGESFWLNIAPDRVEIIGASELGALHGLSTLERMAINNQGKVVAQSTVDGPQLSTRALHIVINVKADSDPNTASTFVSTNDVMGAIHQARLHNYNTLILMLTDRVDLVSYGGVLSNANWTKKEFIQVIAYAQENGLEFIPEIKLLSKVSRFFPNTQNTQVFTDDLLYNYDTYNPQKEAVYKDIVFPIIDELAELHNSIYGKDLKLKPIKAIHIGHDEVAGSGQKSADELSAFEPPQAMLPPDLFRSDVITLNNYIKEKHLKTWMWGDMLISREEYPVMISKGGGGNGLHGSTYTSSNLFSKIPPDIVINDWHYDQISPMFPTALAFALQGHQVLGATWHDPVTTKNFTDYLANIPSPRAQGMIATVWAKGWRKIDEIISVSGDAFWNAKKIQQPLFGFSMSKPADVVVKQGASVTNTVTIKASDAQNTNNNQVLLYAANLPRDAFIHFLPTASTAQPSYQSEFTITTSRSTPPGDYPVKIKAIVGGNIQTAVFGLTVAYADTVAPAVAILTPADGSKVSGISAITGTATDNVGVAGVQFQVDGVDLGSENTVSPYGVSWNTTSAADGAHVLTAVARDAAGNTTTSTAVGVTVDNAPSVISAVAATGVTSNGAIVVWTTSEPGDTQVEYGTSTAYGMRTALSAALVTAHSQALSGLTSTIYHFRVRSRDAAGNMAVSADQTLILKSIGIWPGPAFGDHNPFINDSIFGWQVFGAKALKEYCAQYPGECSQARPVIISYAPAAGNDAYSLSAQTTTIKANVDSLLADMAYRPKIAGITWDWEYSDTNAIANALAFSVLKDMHEYAHSKGLLFGLTVQPGNRGLYNAGLVKDIYTNSADIQADLAEIKNYSDFFMPMEYVQWFGGDPGNSCLTDPLGPEACWNQRKTRINNDLAKFGNMGIPVIALSTIKTTATDPVERLSACQMYDVYKNVLYSVDTSSTADAFAVWNSTHLNSNYAAVFKAVSDLNPYKSSICPVDGAAPVISAVAAKAVASNGATIVWTTSEPGDTQVEYGTSAAYVTMYASMTALNDELPLVTAHSQSLSGLSASTLYHFRVRSYDAAGNLAFSEDSTFTTAAGSLAPVITSDLISTGTVGTALSYQIAATNSPTSFNAAGLPTGLSVNTGGLISGTPTTSGTSSVTISAANSSGTGSASLTLNVYSACDLNRDEKTNAADVQLQINQAIHVSACTSDLNRDGACNVADVQRDVNASLGGPCVVGP